MFSIQKNSTSIIPLLKKLSSSSSSTPPSPPSTTYSSGFVTANTEVILEDVAVKVTAGNQLSIRLLIGDWYGDAYTETFNGGSPVVTYQSTLNLSAGTTVSGNMGSAIGNGALVTISDQTYGMGTWKIISQKMNSTLWLISIERLLTGSKIYTQSAVCVHFNDLFVSVDNGNVWTTINLPSTDGLYAGLITNSKYITYETDTGDLYTSQNGGSTFTQIQPSVYWDVANIATSLSGQYQYLINGDDHKFYKSNDYGQTWTTTLTVSNPSYYTWVTTSKTGQYVSIFDKTATPPTYNWNFRTSSNYGVTFSVVNITTSSSDVPKGICMSGDGSIMIAISNLGNVYKSTNFGASWSIISTIPAQYAPTRTDHYMWAISCSSLGDYVTTVDCSGFIWKSVDGGLTWTNNMTIDGIPQTSVVTATTCFITCDMSGDGKYQIVGSYWDNSTLTPTVHSFDFGQTWTTVSAPFGTAGGVGMVFVMK